MSKNRKDGRYIKQEDAIHAIIPYLMENRTEAEVYMKETLDITNLKKWIEKTNKNLDYKMTYFHALSAIFAKTIYNRPLLNRFVQGHRTYERDKVSISFIAKDKFSDSAEEKIIVMDINPDDKAIDLGKEMSVDVFNTRKSGTNDMDKSLKLIAKMPRFILRIFVRIVKRLDYHGWVPKCLSDGDSNFATVLVSNLGSIKCESCYHHLNNYGTNSIVITIGTVREENEKVLVDISCTLDERIADGFYFAKSLKLIKYLAENPKLLEESMNEVVSYEQKN